MDAEAEPASALLDRLLALREETARAADLLARAWRPAPGDACDDALTNLARYVALRRHDLRGLQRALVPYGLSSLGRLESHVLETIDAVCQTLARITGEMDDPRLPRYHPPERFLAGERILAERAARLFGDPPPHGTVTIMVTLDPRKSPSVEEIAELIARQPSMKPASASARR